MSDSESDVDIKELKSNVELGFLETSPKWKLQSRFFPSKVGSKPAWLSLSDDIPCSKDLVCSTCNRTLVLLCQLYAPVTEKETCFHRTVYIFVCKTDNCIKSNLNNGFKVVRNQLSRHNKYYPFDPPIEEENWKSDLCAETFGIKLCYVCGIRSSNHCGSCKNVYYCCKEHQVFDWKSGHKQICKGNSKDRNSNNVCSLLFPEFEIVTEFENDLISENEEEEDLSELNKTERCSKGSLQVVSCEEELTKMALCEEDKTFSKFRKQIKLAPEQVIRYERNGIPLWITNNISFDIAQIPNCQYCGGRRIFEFQVLPQLLNYLGLEVSRNSLDWGTLVIFTCENSCDNGPDYKEEYLLKQDLINSTTLSWEISSHSSY
ncbi:zinc finger protein RP-8 [Lycorma delicatula]|uniref:zinc finger protein RP-8 n=1 Tax=Lycorma delicatula TaxID=130591 RepID=UPI003F510BD7